MQTFQKSMLHALGHSRRRHSETTFVQRYCITGPRGSSFAHVLTHLIGGHINLRDANIPQYSTSEARVNSMNLPKALGVRLLDLISKISGKGETTIYHKHIMIVCAYLI